MNTVILICLLNILAHIFWVRFMRDTDDNTWMSSRWLIFLMLVPPVALTFVVLLVLLGVILQILKIK